MTENYTQFVLTYNYSKSECKRVFLLELDYRQVLGSTIASAIGSHLLSQDNNYRFIVSAEPVKVCAVVPR